MNIVCDEPKRKLTLAQRGLDMLRAGEIFAGMHLTRPDDRLDYGEPRFVTVGELDGRFVAFVWTPRGGSRRIISMRHCHEREAQKIRSALAAL